MPRSLLLATSLLLASAIGLVIYGSTRPQERTFHGRLVDILPEAPPGWTRTLRPIADTPEMKKAVGEVLNFDDAIFADYTLGVNRLSVYVAYWTPGKMQHRQVASHTPDICWVGAGWTCTERGVWPSEPNQQSDGPTVLAQRTDGDRTANLPSPRSSLPALRLPAESRTFTSRGSTEHVWFWHIVGGRPISYGPQTPPWYASIVDMLTKGLDQREEQFFIRLSAPQPLESPDLSAARDPVLRWIAERGR